MGQLLESVIRRQREQRAVGARHRRGDDDPLVETVEHARPRSRRRLPVPSGPALMGVAVLVLIGGGAAHLVAGGSAIGTEPAAPLPTSTTIAAEAGAEGAGGEPPAASAAPPSAAAPYEGSASASPELVVHVSGAVASPGLVRLPAGSRIDDALRAAGGASEGADLSAINLARSIADGEQIHVPMPGEAPIAPPASGAASSGPGSAPAADARIDINTASAEQLQELPGVGPAIAARIIEHREANGPFASVDQLEEVSGIGPKTLEKIREKASV